MDLSGDLLLNVTNIILLFLFYCVTVCVRNGFVFIFIENFTLDENNVTTISSTTETARFTEGALKRKGCHVDYSVVTECLATPRTVTDYKVQ